MPRPKQYDDKIDMTPPALRPGERLKIACILAVTVVVLVVFVDYLNSKPSSVERALEQHREIMERLLP